MQPGTGRGKLGLQGAAPGTTGLWPQPLSDLGARPHDVNRAGGRSGTLVEQGDPSSLQGHIWGSLGPIH